MLHLQDGVADANDPAFFTASQYEEKPDGMSIEDFMKSLVSGTITGTVWVGEPAVETPVSFAFPQRVSTTAGDAPLFLNQVSGDDTNGYTGSIAVDDYFDYHDSNIYSYGNQEWTIALQPAGRISIAATDDQASEDNADAATFTITPTGSAGAYALFTVSGTAICGGTLYDETDPNADYVIYGAEAMPDEPGKFKAYFNPNSGVAEVNVIPLNDDRVEDTEDIQLTLVADEPPTGACPAYADPTTNADAQPAAASNTLKDLRVTSNSQQIPYAALDDIIGRLGSETPGARQQASDELVAFLVHYPYSTVEDYATAKADATGDPDVRGRAITALGNAASTPRLRIYGNGSSLSFVPVSTGADAKFQVQVSPPYLPLLTVNQSGILSFGSEQTVDLTPTNSGAGMVTVTVSCLELIHDDNTNIDVWAPVSGSEYSVSFFVTVQSPA
jgi:hypothetical protein